MIRFNVLTIFPEIFEAVNCGILKKAVEKGLVSINEINIRDFSKCKHKNTDDYPYGGGEGMLLTVQPVLDAWKSIQNPGKTIYMSPKGEVLTQEKCLELSKFNDITLICGRYEGIDERIIDSVVDEEISIGDYVVSGGEIPAMILIDSVSRMLEGVLGNSDGYCNESHFDGLLEAPQYTRPEEYEGMFVPKVLLSGNHKEIEKYKFQQSLIQTYKKRPDMIKKRKLTVEEAKILIEVFPQEEIKIKKLINKNT